MTMTFEVSDIKWIKFMEILNLRACVDSSPSWSKPTKLICRTLIIEERLWQACNVTNYPNSRESSTNLQKSTGPYLTI